MTRPVAMQIDQFQLCLGDEPYSDCAMRAMQTNPCRAIPAGFGVAARFAQLDVFCG